LQRLWHITSHNALSKALSDSSLANTCKSTEHSAQDETRMLYVDIISTMLSAVPIQAYCALSKALQPAVLLTLTALTALQ
jgi:hypothetical protein